MDKTAFLPSTGALGRLQPLRRRRVCTTRTRPPQALYVNNEDLVVEWLSPISSGSFGTVYFGRDTRQELDVVVKCPVDAPLARGLYATEKYVNNKLRNTERSPRSWAEYIGEVVLPRDQASLKGLARVGLVWKREGVGQTLEEMLERGEFFQLASRLYVSQSSAFGGALRRELFIGSLWWLLQMVKALHSLGLYHRDIKPANIIVSHDSMAPLKAIDFGSTVDWKTPFKRGLSTPTCDEVYGPPERKINLFAADRFDIYAVGLLGLRILLPSLTPEGEMKSFIENVVRKSGHDLPRICVAAQSGAKGVKPQTKQEFEQLLDGSHQDIFSLLKCMIRENPKDRMTAEQLLNDTTFDSFRHKVESLESLVAC